MLLLVTEGSVEYKKLLEVTGTHAVIGICHRNFGPENFGPWTEIFSGKFLSVKMVCPWKFGPGYANWKHSLWYI